MSVTIEKAHTAQAQLRQTLPCWSALELAGLLGFHHLTILKKAQGRRGDFALPEGGFKLGRHWRWRDEDVQAFLLKMSGAESAQQVPDETPAAQVSDPARRPPGRPRKIAAGSAA